MRTDLIPLGHEAASVRQPLRRLCVVKVTTHKAGENPVRGVRACGNASSFNAAGVGSFRLATGGTGTDYPGD